MNLCTYISFKMEMVRKLICLVILHNILLTGSILIY